ncbi:hypothetical protein ASPVEDRAFT_77746 [Aspergillus versicolor CBS 583.65]|uniref:Major facilitator superfamily (MFS) profile domain-containing protein n=1 Tax=Aspergillus versicolor CBS 583.65 TaxID=1036611 RepID=A0A1L9P389_ASPVE|nr:uncharacterized protein ASPVEDRAFT_77746 [Aspergillus versicolor CBS 583.65]OJI95971.1 hypothetical protein ASPVEDRAFT_77746 [Aspergillus versicolor CBS 583.65]
MSSYTQIPQGHPDPDLTPSDNNPPHDSSLRIYWLAAVVCCGGLLFGYDSGVIGGVLTFDSFLRDFQYSAHDQTQVSAIAVGIQQAGALAGCLLIWPLTNRHGRRRAMMLCSSVFCLGVLFEIINSHSLLIFYIGRIICGLGVGGSATVSPIYLAEMSPRHLRARLGSGYQFTFTVGIFASYWIDYALQFRAPTPAQWQIPLALQLVPGALMGLGMLSLTDSVRWLLANGHTHAAWTSLLWIRGADNKGKRSNSPSAVAVAVEFAEMKRAVDDDRTATANFHPRELLLRPNLHRIALAVFLFVAQQATGATALAYFGPQFFGLLVGAPNAGAGTGEEQSKAEAATHSLTLFLTGIFGALKVLSCLFFLIFVADRFGRKPLLGLGALGMAGCMIFTSILLKSQSISPPPPPAESTTSSSISPTSIITILLIYTAITVYNLSWGPLPWPLTAEFFPTRLRSPGVSLAVASQWASNFIWSSSTPYILRDLGWATFLLFGVLDLGIAAVVWVYLPETRGLSLEEVQGVFDSYRGVDHEGDDYEEEREGLVRQGSFEGEEDGEEGRKSGASMHAARQT